MIQNLFDIFRAIWFFGWNRTDDLMRHACNYATHTIRALYLGVGITFVGIFLTWVFGYSGLAALGGFLGSLVLLIFTVRVGIAVAVVATADELLPIERLRGVNLGHSEKTFRGLMGILAWLVILSTYAATFPIADNRTAFLVILTAGSFGGYVIAGWGFKGDSVKKGAIAFAMIVFALNTIILMFPGHVEKYKAQFQRKDELQRTESEFEQQRLAIQQKTLNDLNSKILAIEQGGVTDQERPAYLQRLSEKGALLKDWVEEKPQDLEATARAWVPLVVWVLGLLLVVVIAITIWNVVKYRSLKPAMPLLLVAGALLVIYLVAREAAKPVIQDVYAGPVSISQPIPQLPPQPEVKPVPARPEGWEQSDLVGKYTLRGADKWETVPLEGSKYYYLIAAGGPFQAKVGTEWHFINQSYWLVPLPEDTDVPVTLMSQPGFTSAFEMWRKSK